MMTLAIGNRSKTGFTFIEVMVTAAILALGIVCVYKAFFISLNTLRHLTHRLYALTLLDNHIVAMQKRFETKKETLIHESAERKTVTVENTPVTFSFDQEIKTVGSHENLYALDAGIAWPEGARTLRLHRQILVGAYGE